MVGLDSEWRPQRFGGGPTSILQVACGCSSDSHQRKVCSHWVWQINLRSPIVTFPDSMERSSHRCRPAVAISLRDPNQRYICVSNILPV